MQRILKLTKTCSSKTGESHAPGTQSEVDTLAKRSAQARLGQVVRKRETLGIQPPSSLDMGTTVPIAIPSHGHSHLCNKSHSFITSFVVMHNIHLSA